MNSIQIAMWSKLPHLKLIENITTWMLKAAKFYLFIYILNQLWMGINDANWQISYRWPQPAHPGGPLNKYLLDYSMERSFSIATETCKHV